MVAQTPTEQLVTLFRFSEGLGATPASLDFVRIVRESLRGKQRFERVGAGLCDKVRSILLMESREDVRNLLLNRDALKNMNVAEMRSILDEYGKYAQTPVGVRNPNFRLTERNMAPLRGHYVEQHGHEPRGPWNPRISKELRKRTAMLIGAQEAEHVEPVVDGIHLMYGGEVEVRFDPNDHRYLVKDSRIGPEWFRAPSVTGILGRMLDKSKPLVSWSTRLAKQAFQARVQPGRAYSQNELDGIGAEIEYAHKAALDHAGRIGSQVHQWVESYLNARAGKAPFPTPPADEQVRAAYSAARKWIIEVNLQPVAVERILYSRSQQFIGTTDLSAFVVNGRPAIVDWKSSKRLHSNYELQLAAYAFMWGEMSGQRLDDRWLIHLKADGSFEARCLPTNELEAHIEAFLLLAAAHRELSNVNLFEREA